jgi:signal transduction histidine kinase
MNTDVCDTRAVEPVPAPEATVDSPPRTGSQVWATVQQATTRWLDPLGERATWSAGMYLALGTLTTPLWFLVVGFLVLVGALAMVTIVGLPLVIPIFAVVGALSKTERSRVHFLGFVVPPRPVADGEGLWSGARARLTDSARWRQVAYHMTAVAIAWTLAFVAFAVWMGALYLATAPLWGFALGTPFFRIVVFTAVGVALAGLAARTTVWCAKREAEYVAWLLGPDRYEVMRSRVENLTADRRQILEAVAGERRRIERNLHDGVQARLVALGIDLGLAESMLPGRADEARDLITSARDKVRASIGELRVIGRGLHPSILEDRGLDAALSAVVAASPVPIRLQCELERVPPPAVEEAAYFIVSEAVSNILKHSGARRASVDVASDESGLRIVVHDDGIGGADSARGSGLAGIEARVRGVDGVMRIASPPGGPTVLAVELPFPGVPWRSMP